MAYRKCRPAVVALLTGLTAVAAGHGAPVGREFQVNSYTTADQTGPVVAMQPNGDFVVVWTSRGSSGNDTSDRSVQGQRFAFDGTPIGGEFQINSYTTSDQISTGLAVDSNGDFVVVWHSYGSNVIGDRGWSVQGRRFISDGTAVSDEFQLSSYTTATQFGPTLAVGPNGDFVAVWTSYGSSGSDSSGWSVQGRRFASDGMAVGDEFQVNSYTTSDQFGASVALDSDGDFMMVWTSYGSGGSDTSDFSIQGQRFAADGTAVDGEFQVNSYTTSSQFASTMAMGSNGDFVVVWMSYGSNGSDAIGTSIQGQRFASGGEAVGGEFQINSYTTLYQYLPVVAAESDGDFIVVWESNGSSGSDINGLSVQGQLFASGGVAVGGEFQVNSYTNSNQFHPTVAFDGHFVVAWTSRGSNDSDNSGLSIWGQRFSAERRADYSPEVPPCHGVAGTVDLLCGPANQPDQLLVPGRRMFGPETCQKSAYRP